MAQLPTIKVRVVDGILLEILNEMLDRAIAINVDILGRIDDSLIDSKIDNELGKIEELVAYTEKAIVKVAEIQEELKEKLDTIHISLFGK